MDSETSFPTQKIPSLLNLFMDKYSTKYTIEKKLFAYKFTLQNIFNGIIGHEGPHFPLISRIDIASSLSNTKARALLQREFNGTCASGVMKIEFRYEFITVLYSE